MQKVPNPLAGPDLDAQPLFGACAAAGVTSRPRANQGRGAAAAPPSANHGAARRPRPRLHRKTSCSTHAGSTCSAFTYTEQSQHTVAGSADCAFVQNIMALYKRHPFFFFALNKKQISIGTVKESEWVFVSVPVPVKMGYSGLIGERNSFQNQPPNLELPVQTDGRNR